MKCVFKIPYANLATAAIKIENQNVQLNKLMGMLNDIRIVFVDEEVDKAMIYINIDKLVQAAGYIDGGALVAASTFQRLDNDDVETFRNINLSVSVAKFVKGTTYLIPVSELAPLSIVPDMKNVLINGVTDAHFAGTHFRFDCVEDTDVLNSTAINDCITCEVLGQAALLKASNRAIKRDGVAKSFAVATGVPAEVIRAVDGGENNNQLVKNRR